MAMTTWKLYRSIRQKCFSRQLFAAILVRPINNQRAEPFTAPWRTLNATA